MQSIIDIALALSTLTLLEIVLGIDNLVFLAIMTERLPQEQRKSARRFGLTLAWVTRLMLLASAVWLTTLTGSFMTIFEIAFSGRDVFMLAGGLFLLVKATEEIRNLIEPDGMEKAVKHYKHFGLVIVQIALLDVVFSLDSVLTAVGLSQQFWVMATAITIAIIAMIFASEPLTTFIEKHPTIKMLALAFLLLIGTVLIADGMHFHVPRGYIYFAMGFSLLVESLNVYRTSKL
ncbi:MAG: TerC family protein [Gammaproteobacteria bacterium]